MVVARRFPRRDSRLNVLQSKAFHVVLKLMLDVPFHDLGCGARAFRLCWPRPAGMRFGRISHCFKIIIRHDLSGAGIAW